MRLAPLKIFAVAAVLSAAGFTSASRAVGDTTLQDISRYREWARVNDVPLTVPIDAASVGG